RQTISADVRHCRNAHPSVASTLCGVAGVANQRHRRVISVVDSRDAREPRDIKASDYAYVVVFAFLDTGLSLPPNFEKAGAPLRDARLSDVTRSLSDRKME
ncbi:hypothetical protein MTO96_036755, partial [Rhipicephalus appendiculatus]